MILPKDQVSIEAGAVHPGPFSPPVNLTPGGLTFNNCSGDGNPAVVTCAATASALWATANPAAGVTPLEIRGISCQISFGSTPVVGSR